MDSMKSTNLKLKTRTLLTFENKSVKKGGALLDTDPTSATLPTTSGILITELFLNTQKKG
jgi:hypothetical protein